MNKEPDTFWMAPNSLKEAESAALMASPEMKDVFCIPKAM